MFPRTRKINSVRPHIEPLEDRTLLATCHVTRLSDAGAGFGFRGDLRYCINKVNAVPGADTIDFTVTGIIQLTGALPDLSTDMDIVGPGSTALTVRRNLGGNYRIFTVGASSLVRISGLTATNGYLPSGDGGGIHNRGTLTLIETRIVGNRAERQGGGVGNLTQAFGGGIHNLGSLLIQDSTIAVNTVYGAGYWADAYGGGIYTAGPLTITNSTISGNYAEAQEANDNPHPFAFGGGIHIEAKIITVTIDNSTIANNTLYGSYTGGSGIMRAQVGPTVIVTHSTIASNANGSGISANNLTLRNSIVANHGAYPDVAGTIKNSGYNLIENPSGGSGYVPSDILSVDPMLGPLADNGGPTLTMALLPGSPAIDSGANQMAPEWDQRGPGFPRIVNGTIDRGAFEVQSTPAPTAPGNFAFLITANIDDDSDAEDRNADYADFRRAKS